MYVVEGTLEPLAIDCGSKFFTASTYRVVNARTVTQMEEATQEDVHGKKFARESGTLKVLMLSSKKDRRFC